jgi:uncharacterized protein YbjQ (UPF0145 family)|tara:strand:- start:529 stop:1044 length:516 start_codon:yes stop_codon:yes gene_type:complete
MSIKPCTICKKEFDSWNRKPDEIFCDNCFADANAKLHAKDNEKKEIQKEAELVREIKSQEIDSLKITTTNNYPNYEVEKVLGVITSECVFGMNVFRDFFSGMTDFFGGRSKASQKVLRDARNTCLYELKKEAHELGGDGIIGIDLDYSEISGKGKGMLFLVASGTVVKFKK